MSVHNNTPTYQKPSRKILVLYIYRKFRKKKTKYLSLPVDANDARSGLMRSGDEDGLPTDPVHINAGASFKVIQVDVAIFGDEKDHILLGADL